MVPLATYQPQCTKHSAHPPRIEIKLIIERGVYLQCTLASSGLRCRGSFVQALGLGLPEAPSYPLPQLAVKNVKGPFFLVLQENVRSTGSNMKYLLTSSGYFNVSVGT